MLRVAFVLRSTEVHPEFFWFVTTPLIQAPSALSTFHRPLPPGQTKKGGARREEEEEEEAEEEEQRQGKEGGARLSLIHI